MVRRVLVVALAALAMLMTGVGVASAQEDPPRENVIESTAPWIWFNAGWYPFPAYVQGYCFQPGYEPTGQITEVWNLPEEWTVEVAWLSPESQSIGFVVNRPQMERTGYQPIEIFYVCKPKENE
jgi:hypothetical protein